MAYAQRAGPYGGRRLSVPKPDFIPGGMTARTIGDHIRSQIKPRADADGKRERDELTYQYFQTMLGSAAPKTTADVRILAELAREMAGGAVTAPTPAEQPKTAPVTYRPGGRLVPTTRGLQEQGLTYRPGGRLMPTARAVQAGAVPGQIGELMEGGKRELARRAIMVERTRAAAAERARRPRQYGTIRTAEGEVIPEELFERVQREKRSPLARSPERTAAAESVAKMRAELEQINAQLRSQATTGTPGVSIQEGPTGAPSQSQDDLRDKRNYLTHRIDELEGTLRGPEPRATETATWRKAEYENRTFPLLQRRQQLDAEIKTAREAYQTITSGAAWDEARRAFRESTDMKSQQAAQRRLRELTGPEAKERARSHLVELARESRALDAEIERAPKAPAAPDLAEEQRKYQTEAERRRAEVYPAEREAARRAAQEAEEKYRTGAAAAEAARTAPTPFPGKPEKVPAKRQPSLDEARRQDVWGRNKGTPFKEWSEEDRVGFGLVAVERNPVKERALQRVIDSLLTPPYQGEEKPAYRQRVERAARALKALDENLYDKIVGAGIAAVGEGEEEADRDIVDRVLGFIGLQRASVAPAPPTVEPTPAPEEQTEGAAGAVPQEETMQPASYEEVEAALDEAGGDREAAEAILNRKGLTAEVEE